MQSECQHLTLHLYRKMSHLTPCPGVRDYWGLKWTSKKLNCYGRVCIPDFTTTNENSCVCYFFLIPCIELFFFLRKESNWEILVCILAGHRAWASLCSESIRAGPDAELGKVPSGEELQPQQELWVSGVRSQICEGSRRLQNAHHSLLL